MAEKVVNDAAAYVEVEVQGIEGAQGRPIGTGGTLLREGGAAIRGPGGIRSMELIIGKVTAVGVGHSAGAGIHGDETPGSIEAQVVVVQEEGIVAQLVGQGARPVLVERAAGVAVAVPDGADMDHAGGIGDGDVLGVGDYVLDDAALVGDGAHAVGGIDAHVGAAPGVQRLAAVGGEVQVLAIRGPDCPAWGRSGIFVFRQRGRRVCYQVGSVQAPGSAPL